MTEQKGSSTRPNSELTPDQFAIGEIAIYWRPGATGHGMDVTIASSASWRTVPDRITGLRVTKLFYRVAEPSPDGKLWSLSREYLRKKKPPRKDLEVVRWSECPWQPESLHV